MPFLCPKPQKTEIIGPSPQRTVFLDITACLSREPSIAVLSSIGQWGGGLWEAASQWPAEPRWEPYPPDFIPAASRWIEVLVGNAVPPPVSCC